MRVTGLKYWVLVLALVCVQVYAKTNTVDLPVYTDAKPVVMVSKDKVEFVIKLKSNPTTGYSWFLRDYDSKIVEPVSHVYEAPTDKKLMGAPGYELWTFKIKSAGFVVPQRTTLRFMYARPWEPGGTSMASETIFWVTTN